MTSSLGCHLYLVEAPAEAGFHGDGKARVALKGLWVNFTHLVVTMKPWLSAAALTWVSTLLKFSFSWLKRPDPILIFFSLMQLTSLLGKEI